MTQRSSTRAPLPAADAVSLNVLAPLDVQKPRTHDDAPPFGDEQPSRRPVSTRWRLERGSQQFRFTLLFLAVLVVFSGYFAFDVPSITSIDLKEALRIDNEQLGLLFSVYALPNAIIPLLSGPFFSKYGRWSGVIAIATLIFSGICVTGLGVYSGMYWLMVVGRLVYGLGGESIYVGVDILVTRWFKGAEMGLAYGLVQSAGQAGSFTAFVAAPPINAALGSFKSIYGVSVGVAATALGALVLGRRLEAGAYTVKTPSPRPSSAALSESAVATGSALHPSMVDREATGGSGNAEGSGFAGIDGRMSLADDSTTTLAPPSLLSAGGASGSCGGMPASRHTTGMSSVFAGGFSVSSRQSTGGASYAPAGGSAPPPTPLMQGAVGDSTADGYSTTSNCVELTVLAGTPTGGAGSEAQQPPGSALFGGYGRPPQRQRVAPAQADDSRQLSAGTTTTLIAPSPTTTSSGPFFTGPQSTTSAAAGASGGPPVKAVGSVSDAAFTTSAPEVFVDDFDDIGDDDAVAASEVSGTSSEPAAPKHHPCPGLPVLAFLYDTLELHHLQGLPRDFWLVLAAIACYSSAFYTFLAFGNAWLSAVFGLDETHTGKVVGAVSITSMLVSPVAGLVMDRVGGHRQASFWSMLGACCAFYFMGFSTAAPWLSVFIAGAFYSCLPSSLYPLLVELVPEQSFAVVYAVVNAVINMMLTAVYYIAGWATTMHTASSSNVIDLQPALSVESTGEPVAPAAPLLPSDWTPFLDVARTANSEFKPVFFIFCLLTGVGVACTAVLARSRPATSGAGAASTR